MVFFVVPQQCVCYTASRDFKNYRKHRSHTNVWRERIFDILINTVIEIDNNKKKSTSDKHVFVEVPSIYPSLNIVLLLSRV